MDLSKLEVCEQKHGLYQLNQTSINRIPDCSQLTTQGSIVCQPLFDIWNSRLGHASN